MTKRIINIIYFIIISIFFYFILKSEMINMVINNLNTTTTQMYTYRGYIVLLFILLITHLILFNKTFKEKVSFFIKFLLLMIYALTFIHSVSNPLTSKIYYILNFVPLLFFIFISNTTYYVKDDKYFAIVFICIFILLVINYLQTYIIRSTELYMITNNSAYTILYLLPFVLCFDNKTFKYCMIFIVAVAVLLSFKRGAIITLIYALLIYVITIRIIQKKKNISTIFFIVVFFLVSYFIFVWINNHTNNIIIDRFQNIKYDEGSGRLQIYSLTWNMICNSHMINLLFGHGWDAVNRDSILNLSAHNDLLEIIYNFGIIVMLVYIGFIFHICKYARTLIIIKSKYAPAFITSVVIFIIMSTISHIVVYPNYMSIFCIFWGYVIGRNREIVLNRKLI